MSLRSRWLLAIAVVLVAMTVALWPRGTTTQPLPAQPVVNLAASRTQAALEACPHPNMTAPATSPLRGLAVICAATGEQVDLGNVLAGGSTLVNVWASWCSPCQTELPVLASYAASAQAIPVLTIQVQSDQVDGLRLLASLGVHLPTVFDAQGTATQALRLPEGLPASYLVRPDGSATLITQPRVFDSVDAVRQAVDHYLAVGGETGA